LGKPTYIDRRLITINKYEKEITEQLKQNSRFLSIAESSKLVNCHR
jgi:hypothetical protein